MSRDNHNDNLIRYVYPKVWKCLNIENCNESMLYPWFVAQYVPLIWGSVDKDLTSNGVTWRSSKYELLKELERLDFTPLLEKLWEKRREMLRALHIVGYIYAQESALSINHAFRLPTDNPFLMLSRPYGVPYIPATAVKGMMRFYFRRLLEYIGESDVEDVEGTLFGNNEENKERRGCIRFFDGVPFYTDNQDYKLLKLDIINNHFKNWYREGKNPLDVLSPTPVLFVVVKEGTQWHFAWEIDKKDCVVKSPICQWNKLLLKNIQHFDSCSVPESGYASPIDKFLHYLLTWGLLVFGIGAKVRVGYGRMRFLGRR